MCTRGATCHRAFRCGVGVLGGSCCTPGDGILSCCRITIERGVDQSGGGLDELLSSRVVTLCCFWHLIGLPLPSMVRGPFGAVEPLSSAELFLF